MKVKGSALRARLLWVQQRGDDAWSRFVKALPERTSALATQGVMVNSWYEFDDFVALNVTIDRLFGRGDLALCKELGRFGCDVNLPTIYKILFKFGSVQTILRRSAAAWHVNYDEGELKVLEERDGFARLRVTGVPAPHRAHCLSVFGWIIRAGELSGGKVISEAERCVLKGDKFCEFDLGWQ